MAATETRRVSCRKKANLTNEMFIADGFTAYQPLKD